MFRSGMHRRFRSLLIVLISLFTWRSGDFTNNVCKSFSSYIFDANGDCYYEPDVEIHDASVIIRRHTGIIETYEVTTEDGYILTIYRIPRKNSRGVIWLQHPVSTDAIIWVSQSNNSLAFLLYEAGYDVWIPSQRGTTSSPGHVSLTNEDFEYWDYTFHEIGIYDFRSINRLIVEETNRTDIVFIGHSMSSTSSLIYASTYPEEARKNVKVFINMATPVYFEHMPFYMKLLALMEVLGTPLTDYLRLGAAANFENPLVRLYIGASMYYPLNVLILFLIDFTHGFTNGEQDPRALPLLRKIPRGFSFKMLFHFCQLARTKSRFQQFNYGKARNKEVYGSEEPPVYLLDRITAPLYFIYSDCDYLATEKDNDELYRRLPVVSKKYGRHKLDDMNHVNYFLGRNYKTKVYDHLLNFIDTRIYK